jgi:hypothetical protein
MRSVHRTIRAPSFLANIRLKLALLFRIGFRSMRRSEIHVNIKVNLVALNRRRRRFCVRHTIYHIYQGHRRQYSGNSACVYGTCSVKNKMENETNLTDCTSNET